MNPSSRCSKMPAELSASTQQQLNVYAIAACAAGVGVLALLQPAEAKIVYTPAHRKISFPSTFHLDLNHDRITDFDLINNSVSSGKDFKMFVNVVPRSGQVLGQKFLYASALPAGIPVGPDRPFSRSNQIMASWYVRFSTNTYFGYRGQWANSGKGVSNRYLGLSFNIKGKKHFGWARLSVTVTKGRRPKFTATLTGYAYETIPNKAIITGKTKGPDDIDSRAIQPKPASVSASTREPATLGLLAMGAQGLSIRRRESVGSLP